MAATAHGREEEVLNMMSCKFCEMDSSPADSSKSERLGITGRYSLADIAAKIVAPR